MSGTCGNGKDTWNMVIAGDEQVRSDPSESISANTDDIIATDIIDTEGSRYYVINSSLPPERKHTVQAEALEQLAPSSRLLMQHYGRIQDMFTKVTDASTRLDAIHNKLSLLRDASNSFKANPVKSEDDDAMPNPTLTDPMALHYICILLWMFFSCDTLQVLAQHCGNPNPDQASSMMPWAFYIIPSDPINIPMQLMKRKSQADMSAGLIPKHAKLEVP
ncbi:hypothetical protein EV401DRAFT_2138659 [Pisolithus croceorrhizus]|nr:hypothetical protein EV401DRAFT_2138659 [Pisolithus croceorrhizus]